MGKTLYLDCHSGISGDMTVAALLDLGADQSVLEKVLESLPVEGFQIKISRVKKSGLDLCDFDVILEKEWENHDHDMEYLYGRDLENQDHGKEHHEHHKHSHRNLKEIIEILHHTHMTENAKKIAVSIFEILAQAEASAHGVEKDQVHFHEVGAVDSIVDVVATAVCLDNLEITQTIVTKLNEGQGMVRCQHGWMPVPVPAVTNIVEHYGIPLHITQTEGELVTPTGAAIVAAIRSQERLPEKFKIQKIGMGAGKRKYERPSFLRAMLIEEDEKEDYEKEEIICMETNVDDCTGEAMGYVMEQLFLQGARDVAYLPVYMKKNRPAYQLHVVCKEEDVERLAKVIFEHTTTIGIRYTAMKRIILQREIRTVQTIYGEAEVKVCQLDSGERWYPEYESVARLCRKTGISYMQMYEIIKEQGKQKKFNLQ